MGTPLDFQLSNEQQLFIEKALQGENILVDACIGSGKTTAIQNLCNELPSKKKVLYLTYTPLYNFSIKNVIQGFLMYNKFANKKIRKKVILYDRLIIQRKNYNW
jgi:tRNA A37 threonylcarbamoyladenosine biosynthesis protein TsaE